MGIGRLDGLAMAGSGRGEAKCEFAAIVSCAPVRWNQPKPGADTRVAGIGAVPFAHEIVRRIGRSHAGDALSSATEDALDDQRGP